MSKRQPTFGARLFFSYSHQDSQYRAKMADSLSLLVRRQLLTTWSDLSIAPGESISNSIRREINTANIIAFLLSHNFIRSDACMEEWNIAKRRSKNGLLIRIPIILSDCPWPDLLECDDIKALPRDCVPITRFEHHDEAWQQIYEGIKKAIEILRNTHSPKPQFFDEAEKTYFSAQRPIKLRLPDMVR